MGIRLGVPPIELVAYSAALNIVLVATTLLNTFSLPILQLAISSFSEGNLRVTRKIYIKTCLMYCFALLLVVLVTALAGSNLIEIYVGSKYELNTLLLVGIAISEGFATITVLPKIFLLAINRATLISRYWSIGTVIFIGLLLCPIDPITKIVISPGISGLFIFGASSLIIASETKP